MEPARLGSIPAGLHRAPPAPSRRRAVEEEPAAARVTAAAEGWTADRLGAVERSALRVAVHELETDDVPAEVAISEAVAFTKRYASDDGAKLVNGILGRIQREEAA